MWKYYCYTNNNGINEIEDWYLSLAKDDKRLQSHINVKLGMIRGMTKAQLINNRHIDSHKTNRKTKGKKQDTQGDTLWEIIIEYRGNEYRIVFYFIEEEHAIVMLHAFHKKDKTHNRKGFSAGTDKMKEVLENENRKQEYYFTKN